MAASFRIATFNLESLDDRPGLEPGLEARIAVLRPQLQRLAADVLCLQEVNGQEAGRGPDGAPRRRLSALDALLAGTAYEGYERAATAGEHGPYDRHNLVILSRFPIAERAQVRNQAVPPPSYRPVTAEPPAAAPAPVAWDRPILTAAIDLGAGRRLHVLNLHLRAPLAAFIPGQKESAFVWKTVSGWAEGFFLSTVKRTGQALEARILIDRLFDADPEALVAVCGDFNAHEREMPVRIVMGDPDDTGSGALAMRAMVALEESIPEDRRYSVVHAGHKVMLDHLLVSRPLMAWYRGAEVHNEGLGDEMVGYASVHASPESFHAPVVATFAVPEP